ncbi:hypothetical protein MC885_020201 [Smutsia gigantea]|nr:hypothetical protein MC885_020201 [Smutsia gigantea]
MSQAEGRDSGSERHPLSVLCASRVDGPPGCAVVIVCKRRGYSYELKEVIELLFHKMTDDPMNNKDVKKVGCDGQGAGGDPHMGEEREIGTGSRC